MALRAIIFSDISKAGYDPSLLIQQLSDESDTLDYIAEEKGLRRGLDVVVLTTGQTAQRATLARDVLLSSLAVDVILARGVSKKCGEDKMDGVKPDKDSVLFDEIPSKATDHWIVAVCAPLIGLDIATLQGTILDVVYPGQNPTLLRPSDRGVVGGGDFPLQDAEEVIRNISILEERSLNGVYWVPDILTKTPRVTAIHRMCTLTAARFSACLEDYIARDPSLKIKKEFWMSTWKSRLLTASNTASLAQSFESFRPDVKSDKSYCKRLQGIGVNKQDATKISLMSSELECIGNFIKAESGEIDNPVPGQTLYTFLYKHARNAREIDVRPLLPCVYSSCFRVLILRSLDSRFVKSSNDISTGILPVDSPNMDQILLILDAPTQLSSGTKESIKEKRRKLVQLSSEKRKLELEINDAVQKDALSIE